MRILVIEMNISHYKTKNRAKEQEIKSLEVPEKKPSPFYSDNDTFQDTGGSMRDFETASKQVASILKHC